MTRIKTKIISGAECCGGFTLSHEGDTLTIASDNDELLADVRAALPEGRARVGRGRASGDRCIVRAAEAALGALGAEARFGDATGVVVSIAGDPDLTLDEVSAAASLIEKAAHEDATILLNGHFADPDLKAEAQVTVIAAAGSGARP